MHLMRLIIKRVKYADGFSFDRVGQVLTLQAVAIRSKSGDESKFGDAVLTAVENTDLPLILCSYDPKMLEIGLEIALDRNPLDRKSTRLNSSHIPLSRMPSSA